MLRRREAAREALLAKFAGDDHVLTEEEVLRIISSVADSNNYQAAASAPVIRMLQFLDDTFSSSVKNDALGDLSISCVLNRDQSSSLLPHGFPLFSLMDDQFSAPRSYGKGGSKLSHSHATQYTFVKQSMLLWKEVRADSCLSMPSIQSSV